MTKFHDQSARLRDRIVRVALPRDIAVELFALNTDAVTPLVSAATAILTDEERATARRFVRRADGDRFVLRRAGRRMLAEDLGVSIDHRQFGRPVGSAQWPGISFASSVSLALFAFSRSRSVGVDIELIRPLGDVDRLAAICCSTAERAWLASQAPAEATRRFLRLWTLKEAWVKAEGRSIADDLTAHCVAAIDMKGRGSPDGNVQFHQVESLPGYACAVAYIPVAPARSLAGELVDSARQRDDGRVRVSCHGVPA